MTAEELYETLKRIQEPKGFFFNKDKNLVLAIVQDLLTNKERYGYMSCPCRLAAADSAKDRDIVCPCVYRRDDVKEYGSCYCNLYVSEDWNTGKIEHKYVPERRPAEKMAF